MVREKTREYAILKDLLGADEKVVLEVVEHRLGGGRWIGPVHAYATNKRIIMIRRHIVGIHKTVKMIRYDHITEVRVERGIIFGRIHFSLIGEHEEREGNLKWLVGLTYKDSVALVNLANKMQEERKARGS